MRGQSFPWVGNRTGKEFQVQPLRAADHGVVEHLLFLFLQGLVRNLGIKKGLLGMSSDMLVAEFAAAYAPVRRLRSSGKDKTTVTKTLC